MIEVVPRPLEPAVGAGPTFRALFEAEFATMFRLAALLGADDPEDVAQEAFARLHLRWNRLSDPDAAGGYLRTIVVNLTRSRRRHLRVVGSTVPAAPGVGPSAEETVLDRADHRAVLDALHRLTRRHREALVLRYWLDLPVAQVASSMGTSLGTAKSHLSRGLDALRSELGRTRSEGSTDV